MNGEQTMIDRCTTRDVYYAIMTGNFDSFKFMNTINDDHEFKIDMFD